MVEMDKRGNMSDERNEDERCNTQFPPQLVNITGLAKNYGKLINVNM
jgi:hypothetical protein